MTPAGEASGLEFPGEGTHPTGLGVRRACEAGEARRGGGMEHRARRDGGHRTGVKWGEGPMGRG